MSAYFWFEGISFHAMVHKREIIEESRDKFVIRDEDTVILSYPKSGTNWLIETVCLIQTKGNPKWIQSVPVWQRSPWIETKKGFPILINKEGPRLMSSHLPFHLFPKSFFRSKAKVALLMGIFILCHALHISNWSFQTSSRSSPRVPCGSWFEHTRNWLSMRENDNFLLISYEDMKKNTRVTIEKICDFLGKKLEPDELDLVLKYSSFQAMKEIKMSNFSLNPEDVLTNGLVHMRKGTTGDWKNHFTVAQAEAFDKVFQEKMAGFPPGLFPWK
ncbi:probable alcohol sulfotransferase isoform X2 [Peromyscus leucopus]|uniref:probable alcohol sulfotransferase isoform X2 n=1 Tax=Peromyscus leucopus TaxID=10041 RepID=UPI0018852DA9|nr:probable alcohol sulfotransferase isoform X2 [Peromyscus leucopus]